MYKSEDTRKHNIIMETLQHEKKALDVSIKYKQTLQEIKAIVKNICDGCTSECDCDEDCNYFLITEQLTKVEEE